MRDTQPFEDVPHKLSVQLRRAFVATRTFHKALRAGADVVRAMQQSTLSGRGDLDRYHPIDDSGRYRPAPAQGQRAGLKVEALNPQQQFAGDLGSNESLTRDLCELKEFVAKMSNVVNRRTRLRIVPRGGRPLMSSLSYGAGDLGRAAIGRMEY
ncbi:hypothetical protein EVAR_79373_1 [Eumeta japonica]|uniref:Uncharacterized protein n=1 Tax=Eumeta variegata TaxID=151549 RepID=A0A4C1TFR3_EUMVA|nr:hypothetical protein EVAR_79373_1 [Eumeta japonica]